MFICTQHKYMQYIEFREIKWHYMTRPLIKAINWSLQLHLRLEGRASLAHKSRHKCARAASIATFFQAPL